MKDYIAKFKDKDIDSISIVFYFKDGKADILGKNLLQIDPSFTHDGFGWDKKLIAYFEKNHPYIFKIMETDPELTMHTTYFPLTKENEAVSKRFIEVMEDIIEQELLIT